MVENTAETKPAETSPKVGDLRIAYVPQIPMPAFERDVPDLETAHLLLDTICAFSLFEFQHNVKPDYADIAGIYRYEADGDGGFDWFAVEDDEIAEAISQD